MFKVDLQVDNKPKSSLSSCLFGQKRSFATAMIQASNPHTLNDYSTAPLEVDADHLPKLRSWIHKQKYTIDDSNADNTLDLTVGGLFNYQLVKKPKSNLDKIKELMADVDSQKSAIDRENKLFSYWLSQLSTPMPAFTASAQNFYHRMAGTGHVDLPSSEDNNNNNNAEDQQRGESGLLSALEEPGSSSMF